MVTELKIGLRPFFRIFLVAFAALICAASGGRAEERPALWRAHPNESKALQIPAVGPVLVAQARSPLAEYAAAGAVSPAAIDPAPPAPGCRAPDAADSAAPGKGKGGYLIGIDDRLRISVYQRPDLSGEYQVREDGRISLPLIGSVDVLDKSLDGLEAAISAAVEKASGRPTRVSLEITQRRPFYIVGQVNNPGGHPFVPGLTVLQAVAIGGGLFRPALNIGTAVDLSREAARLGQADEELKQNLVQRARLLAERAGKTTFEVPERLRKLESAERVAEIIAAEQIIMHQRGVAFTREVSGRDAALVLAGQEIKAMEEQHQRIRQQVELANKEMANAQDLVNRGLSRRSDLFTLQRVAANLEADERDVFARIARAKGALITAQRERDLLEVNRRLNMEEELRAVESQLATNELAVRYSSQIIENLTNVPVTRPSGREYSSIAYQIVRRWRDGQTILDAAEMTELCPGDVLRVVPSLGG